MWRHGDMFIAAIDAIPGDEVKRPGWILVDGEATGRSHRLDRSGAAERLDRGERLYLRVLAERATVLDHRDRPITLPRGLYQVWKPRMCPPGTTPNDKRGGAENSPTRRMTGGCWGVLFAATQGAPAAALGPVL
jgi:hypothetical protein